MIIVDLTLATICFLGTCFPALVGTDTPTGRYQTIQRETVSPGYGGDIIQFHEDDRGVYSIHRVWTQKPEQRRVERLKSNDSSQRQTITKGCVNVMPEVYDKLIKCCVGQPLDIVNRPVITPPKPIVNKVIKKKKKKQNGN